MLKLYGAPRSNYFNMVKAALLEKGIEYEEILTGPSQESDYLARSSMGKIPCIETEQGFLAESLAILDYLEDTYPEKPLLPADAWERAKVRELVHSLTLYVELVGRKGFGVLRGTDVPEHAVESIKTEMPRGAAAVARLAKFSPWIAGDNFTYADLVGYFTFVYAAISAEKNAGIDIFSEVPGSKDWYEKVGERESVKKALADQQT
ncbi:MAG: glutathione S-transferase family protein [Pseudomonadales bacterium]|nr:glutathione S-transferase family protein [Pseudomonadales bacterium]